MGMFEHSFDFSVITVADSAISEDAAKSVGKFVNNISGQTVEFDKIQIIFVCGSDRDALAQVKKQKKKYPKNISVVKVKTLDFGAYQTALQKATGKYIAFPELSARYSKKAFKSVKEFFKENSVPLVKLPVFLKKGDDKTCVDRAYLTKPKTVSLEENIKYATLDLNSCFFVRSELGDISKPEFALKLQLKKGELGIDSKAGYNRTVQSGSEISKFFDLEKMHKLAEKEGYKGEAALSAMTKFAYENGIEKVRGEHSAVLNEKLAEFRRDKEYDYKVSVVIPVYKVEKYVEETFASIRRQNIGFFENVQVIFVDDGSPDKSGEICDKIAKKYPYNVICVHKENGGVSSARNTGIDYATGKYISLCDPDDYFKFKATFSAACELFDKNYDEIDIVSLPITFFEGKTGGHPLNKKFENGSRVIDLRYEPWALQISITSAFVKSEVLKKFKFNTNLRISEDGDVTLRILAQKLKLGVCAGYPYMYRRRADNSSALQNSMAKADYFEACMTDYMLAMIDYYKSIHSYVPDSLKYNFAYELQWRVSYASALSTTVMTDEQVKGYVENFKKVLSYIDDEIIVNNPYASFERKYKMLEIKGTLAPKTELVWNQPAGYKYALTSNGNVVGFYSINPTRIHFADIKDGKLLLEGTSAVINGRFKDVRVDIRVNGKDIPAKALPHANHKVYMWGEPVYDFYAFSCEIDVSSLTLPANIFVVMKCDDIEICKTYITYQKMSKINTKTRNQYYYKDGYVLTASTAGITLEKCDADRRRSLESVYENAISQVKRIEDEDKEEIIKLRKEYFEFKPTVKKPIWLISDRIDKADDNGEAFFKYLVENHSQDVDAYFILSKDSDDFERMSKVGPTVDAFSHEHKLLTLLADKVVSSSANENTLDPFHPYRYIFNDILSYKFIFLQHGVTKDDLSGWLNKYSKNILGFVTSAKREFDSVVKQKAYNYTENEVWLTGMPRFDRLYHDEKKLITIAPTWRKYLVSETDFFTGIRPFNDAIYGSDYLKFYDALLSNEKLIEAAEKYGYTLQFIPHPQMVSAMPAFKFSDKVRVLDAATSYRDLFAQSDLMITDYSSTVFDFAYLRKPIVYVQFDRDEFYSGHSYSKGYFDYERDGFGEVEYDLNSTVDRIIEYMQNGCKLKDKYRERIDNFFAFNDKGSCERIYNKIIDMDK